MENTPEKPTVATELQERFNSSRNWLLCTSIRHLNHAVDPLIPQFSQLIKEQGEENVEFEVAKMILDLKSFYNVGNNMTAEQCKETARLILKEYWYFRPTELRIFFDNCKLNKYTKGESLYNRFDGGVIFEWLKLFCIERDNAIKTNREKEDSRKRSIQVLNKEQVNNSYKKIHSEQKEAKKLNEFMGIPSIGDQLNKAEELIKTNINETTK